jgi:hypothetical protein
MDPLRLVGSPGVRVAAVILALTSGAIVVLAWRGVLPHSPSWIAAIACGILTLLGVIGSFRALYSRWMRFSHLLHVAVVHFVFGVVYLLVVPLFVPVVWVLDPLRLRQDSKETTSWIPRRNSRFDPNSLERLG